MTFSDLGVVLVVLEVHENKTLLVFPRGWEGENVDRVNFYFFGVEFLVVCLFFG